MDGFGATIQTLFVPSIVTTTTDYSSRLIEHLPLVRKIAHEVARRKHLTQEEGDELASQIQWRLVRDDYKALRDFRFESSFGTFVAVVAQRTATDLVRGRLGNWRPSAMARRAGAWAEAYETLRQRDGLSREEALRELERRDLTVSREAIDELEASWTERPGRRFVGPEALVSAAASEPSPEQVALDRERAAQRERALEILRKACLSLPELDRWLLEQFYGGATAEQLARMLPERPERRQLFYRLEKLRDQLRMKLEAVGIRRETVGELFRGPWTEIGD